MSLGAIANGAAKPLMYIGIVLVAWIGVVLITPAIAQDTGGTIQQMLVQGGAFYEAGQYARAARQWQAAEARSRAHHHSLYRALSLSYLSLAYYDLGQWNHAQAAVDESIALFEAHPNPPDEQRRSLAQALTSQGSLLLATGHPAIAFERWQSAYRMYAALDDTLGIVGSQINQVQALQMLGFRYRAQAMLDTLNEQLAAVPEGQLKVLGLRSLGNAYRSAGDVERSHSLLQASLSLATRLGLDGEASTTRMSLAHTLRRSGRTGEASELYHQVADTSPSELEQLEAGVSVLGIVVDERSWDSLEDGFLDRLHNGVMAVTQQSPSRRSVNLQVHLAEQLMRLDQASRSREGVTPLGVDVSALARSVAIAPLLTAAITHAGALEDIRAESYALGTLGHLYEQAGQWADAASVTQKANTLAQSVDAAELAYRWAWQRGRILRHQQDKRGAIAAYEQAAQWFEHISGDMATSPDTALVSFQKDVEPMYREWLNLLIGSEAPSTPPTPDALRHARSILEVLHLRELEQYFYSACLNVTAQSLDQIDEGAAVIYPVFLPDQLAILMALPDRVLKLVTVPVHRDIALDTAQQFFQALNPVFRDSDRLQLAKTLYDWLIQPVTPILEQSAVQTLVFVLDGDMRNLPMAALHDGQHYLVESYPVAIAPTVSLLKRPTPLSARSRVLLGGMTEERQGFHALPGVAKEAEYIATHMSTQVVLNDDFREDNLRRALEREVPHILHLATHGQFSSDVNQTFLLTWDNRIDLEELRQLVQPSADSLAPPLDLLVLSACETAVGDDRALLGLAGLAVRSGAQSTLASLWSVNDASTAEFMAAFYQALAQPGMTKADALQSAQIQLLQRQDTTSHPFHWAPFVLIGNWL